MQLASAGYPPCTELRAPKPSRFLSWLPAFLASMLETASATTRTLICIENATEVIPPSHMVEVGLC